MTKFNQEKQITQTETKLESLTKQLEEKEKKHWKFKQNDWKFTDSEERKWGAHEILKTNKF